MGDGPGAHRGLTISSEGREAKTKCPDENDLAHGARATDNPCPVRPQSRPVKFDNSIRSAPLSRR